MYARSGPIGGATEPLVVKDGKNPEKLRNSSNDADDNALEDGGAKPKRMNKKKRENIRGRIITGKDDGDDGDGDYVTKLVASGALYTSQTQLCPQFGLPIVANNDATIVQHDMRIGSSDSKRPTVCSSGDDETSAKFSSTLEASSSSVECRHNSNNSNNKNNNNNEASAGCNNNSKDNDYSDQQRGSEAASDEHRLGANGQLQLDEVSGKLVLNSSLLQRQQREGAEATSKQQQQQQQLNQHAQVEEAEEAAEEEKEKSCNRETSESRHKQESNVTSAPAGQQQQHRHHNNIIAANNNDDLSASLLASEPIVALSPETGASSSSSALLRQESCCSAHNDNHNQHHNQHHRRHHHTQLATCSSSSSSSSSLPLEQTRSNGFAYQQHLAACSSRLDVADSGQTSRLVVHNSINSTNINKTNGRQRAPKSDNYHNTTKNSSSNNNNSIVAQASFNKSAHNSGCCNNSSGNCYNTSDINSHNSGANAKGKKRPSKILNSVESSPQSVSSYRSSISSPSTATASASASSSSSPSNCNNTPSKHLHKTSGYNNHYYHQRANNSNDHDDDDDGGGGGDYDEDYTNALYDYNNKLNVVQTAHNKQHHYNATTGLRDKLPKQQQSIYCINNNKLVQDNHHHHHLNEHDERDIYKHAPVSSKQINVNVTDNPLLRLGQKLNNNREKFKIYSNPLVGRSPSPLKSAHTRGCFSPHNTIEIGQQHLATHYDTINSQGDRGAKLINSQHYSGHYCYREGNTASSSGGALTLSDIGQHLASKTRNESTANAMDTNSIMTTNKTFNDNSGGGGSSGNHNNNRRSSIQIPLEEEESMQTGQLNYQLAKLSRSNNLNRVATNESGQCDSVKNRMTNERMMTTNDDNDDDDDDDGPSVQHDDDNGDNDNTSDTNELDGKEFNIAKLTSTGVETLNNNQQKQQHYSSFRTTNQQPDMLVVNNRNSRCKYRNCTDYNTRHQDSDHNEVNTKMTKTNHHELLSYTKPVTHDVAIVDNNHPWQSSDKASHFNSEQQRNGLMNRFQLAQSNNTTNVNALNSDQQRPVEGHNQTTLATFQRLRHIGNDYNDNLENNSLSFLVDNSNRGTTIATTAQSNNGFVMLDSNQRQQPSCYNFNTVLGDDKDDHFYQDIMSECENQANTIGSVNHYQSPLYAAPSSFDSITPHSLSNREKINNHHQQQQYLTAKLSKNPWLMTVNDQHQTFNQQPLIHPPGRNPSSITTLITPASLEQQQTKNRENQVQGQHVLPLNHNGASINNNLAMHIPSHVHHNANLSPNTALNQTIGLGSQMLHTFNHSSLITDKSMLSQHYNNQKRHHETSTSKKFFKSILGHGAPVNHGQTQLNSNGTTSASSPSTSSCYGDSTTSANHFTQHFANNQTNKIILMSNSRGSLDAKQRPFIGSQNLGYYHKVTPTKFRESSSIKFFLNSRCGSSSENRLCFYLMLLLIIIFCWLGFVIIKYDLWPRQDFDKVNRIENNASNYTLGSSNNATILFEGTFNLRPQASYMIPYPARDVTILSPRCQIELEHQSFDLDNQDSYSKNMSSPLVNFLFMAMLNKPPTLSDNIIKFSATTDIYNRMNYRIFKWSDTLFSDEASNQIHGYLSYKNELGSVNNNQQLYRSVYNELPSFTCLQPGNWWFYVLNNNDRAGIRIKLRIQYHDRSITTRNPSNDAGENRQFSRSNNSNEQDLLDTAPVCSRESCHHGECLLSNLNNGLNISCICHQGWVGNTCEETLVLSTSPTVQVTKKQETKEELRAIYKELWTKECDINCQDHGICINGTCYCLYGWTGPHCKTKSCPNDCYFNGHCVEIDTYPIEASTGYAFSKRQMELNQPIGNIDRLRKIFLIKNATRINDKLVYRYQYNPNGQQWFQMKSGEFEHPQRISQNLTELANDLSSPLVITLFDYRSKWKCLCHQDYTDEDCSKFKEADCSDGKDNDGDGLVDCDDLECCSETVCKEHMSCQVSSDPEEILRKNFLNTNQLWLAEEMGSDPSTASVKQTLRGNSKYDVLLDSRFDGPQTYSFYDKVKFLIKENSVHEYSHEELFDKKNVAVIRGRVIWQSGKDENETGLLFGSGKPMIAVRVGVYDRLDLGFCITRSDGWFDLLVNGGNYITLSFMKDPFITIKRNIYIKPNTINVIPPVTMVLAGSTKIHQSLSTLTSDRFVWPYDAHNIVPKYDSEQLSSVKNFTSNNCSPKFSLPDIRPRIIYEDRAIGVADRQAKESNYMDAPKISILEPLINNDIRNWHSGIYRNSYEIIDSETNMTYLSSRSALYFKPIVKIDLFGNIDDVDSQKSLSTLKSIIIRIVIEGTIIEEILQPDFNLAYLFTWNRRNVYNQRVYGIATAYISIGYEYKVTNNIKGCEMLKAPKSIIHWSTLTSKLRGFDIDHGFGLGHWDLNVHHRYNIRDNILQMSNGNYLSFGDMYPPVVSSFYQPKLARNNSLSKFTSISEGPNGTIFMININKIIQLNSLGQEQLVLSLPKIFRSNHGVTMLEHYNLVYSSHDNFLYLSASARKIIYKISFDSLRHREYNIDSEDRILDNFERFAGGGLIDYQTDNLLFWQQNTDVPASKVALVDPKSMIITPNGMIFFVDGSHICSIDMTTRAINIVIKGGTTLAHNKGWQIDSNLWSITGPSNVEQSKLPTQAGESKLRFDVELLSPDNIKWNPFDKALYFTDYNSVFRLKQNHRVQAVIIGSQPSRIQGGPTKNDLVRLGLIQAIAIDDRGNLMIVSNEMKKRESKNSLMKLALADADKTFDVVNYQDYNNWLELLKVSEHLTSPHNYSPKQKEPNLPTSSTKTKLYTSYTNNEENIVFKTFNSVAALMINDEGIIYLADDLDNTLYRINPFKPPTYSSDQSSLNPLRMNSMPSYTIYSHKEDELYEFDLYNGYHLITRDFHHQITLSFDYKTYDIRKQISEKRTEPSNEQSDEQFFLKRLATIAVRPYLIAFEGKFLKERQEETYQVNTILANNILVSITTLDDQGYMISYEEPKYGRSISFEYDNETKILISENNRQTSIGDTIKLIYDDCNHLVSIMNQR